VKRLTREQSVIEKPVRTNRFVEPLSYTTELHLHQRRKGKDLACVGHLLSVAVFHARAFQKSAALREAEIVPYLRRAEVARSLPDLFGCKIHENKKGSGLYAMPAEAQRSICGCETQNLRLEICANELRASLVLPSGEVLRDLPAVDHDWRNFVDAALAPERGANRLARLERFLNSNFHYKIMSCPHHFIRLGLTRPYNGLCWLMLDTLFPLPPKEWLEEF
jgi:hypothetical protein